MTSSKPSRAARAAFLLLHIEGLRLALDGERLVVRPASRLTDELRELIRRHRDELVILTTDGSGGFDPRAFPETVKILAEFRRVFGPDCRLRFASEDGQIFGEPSSPGVPVSENHLRPGR
jgi:hypothetical protein